MAKLTACDYCGRSIQSDTQNSSHISIEVKRATLVDNSASVPAYSGVSPGVGAQQVIVDNRDYHEECWRIVSTHTPAVVPTIVPEPVSQAPNARVPRVDHAPLVTPQTESMVPVENPPPGRPSPDDTGQLVTDAEEPEERQRSKPPKKSPSKE